MGWGRVVLLVEIGIFAERLTVAVDDLDGRWVMARWRIIKGWVSPEWEWGITFMEGGVWREWGYISGFMVGFRGRNVLSQRKGI